MEQLITTDLRGREDNTTVQKTVDGCQQVLTVVCLVRRLVEVLKEQTDAEFIAQHLPHYMGSRQYSSFRMLIHYSPHILVAISKKGADSVDSVETHLV